MDNIKTTALYQNIQNDIIKQLGEGCLTDMVLDVVMPMFEPFIEERLSNFKLYREAIEKEIESLHEDLVTLKVGVAPMKEIEE